MHRPWRPSSLLGRLKMTAAVVQAPMAGAQDHALAIAAIKGGGLGSLPCALLEPSVVESQVALVRASARGPLNLNFFCHPMPTATDVQRREQAWRAALEPYYKEYGVGPPDAPPALRRPFDDAMCRVVEAVRPEVVSFHFGLPSPDLLARVKASGTFVMGCATSVEEALWLEERDVDAVIAQGWEAGGHAGRFLPADPSSHMGTLALVPQVVDAVQLPVIAAGGIGDRRGVGAALLLGANAVQIGTAYLHTAEARISPVHRARIAGQRTTVSTNVYTGRHARGFPSRLTEEQGPTSAVVPPFPHGGDAVARLRVADPAAFASTWAGQAVAVSRFAAELGAETFTAEVTAGTNNLRGWW